MERRPLTTSEFYLDEDRAPEIRWDQGAVGQWRWLSQDRAGALVRSLAITPGEEAVTPLITIGHDYVLAIALAQALESISSDGLDAIVTFEEVQGDVLDLVQLPLRPGHPNRRTLTLELDDLEGMTGRIVIRCLAGPNNDPTSDWLAIENLAIGRSDRLALLSARSHKRWRTANEIGHFTQAFEHPLFAYCRSQLLTGEVTQDSSPLLEGKPASHLEHPQSGPRENAFTFGLRYLQDLMPAKPPDFAQRLKGKAEAQDRVRILSVCSGKAEAEESIIAGLDNVELTLFDINEQLMNAAVTRLRPRVETIGVIGDINQLGASGLEPGFDIIICVSGLHHIVELETVLLAANALLPPEGEFWLIWETIGRNGNRLWPEALDMANSLFTSLPPELRRNWYTGRIDKLLTDVDFSAPSFEGIRSSEIDQMMLDVFWPVELFRRNCFLWRLIDPTYSQNYDLTNDKHVSALSGLVEAEYAYWRQGGRPTETNSIYRRR